MKKKLPTIEAISGCTVIAVLGYFLGCEPNVDSMVDSAAPTTANVLPKGSGQFVSTRPAGSRPRGLPVRTGQTILVASFNIQVFGKSKMEKPGMPERIAEVIRQFDVVAIQEIRDRSNESIPALMHYINANGSRYDYVISQPLGRTTSKEQYAFIFNTDTVVSGKDFTYVVDDKMDYLHREPLVARFITRVPQNYQPFSFTLVNIHTDPDEVSQEIPVMHTVLKSVRDFEYLNGMQDDVLLLGDLNAEPHQFGPLGQLPGIMWAIDREPTNTARTNIIDNILFDRELTNEFTGRAGVLDLGDFFGLRQEQVKEISDHLPIWAEFSTVELQQGGAGRVANVSERVGTR